MHPPLLALTVGLNVILIFYIGCVMYFRTAIMGRGGLLRSAFLLFTLLLLYGVLLFDLAAGDRVYQAPGPHFLKVGQKITLAQVGLVVLTVLFAEWLRRRVRRP